MVVVSVSGSLMPRRILVFAFFSLLTTHPHPRFAQVASPHQPPFQRRCRLLFDCCFPPWSGGHLRLTRLPLSIFFSADDDNSTRPPLPQSSSFSPLPPPLSHIVTRAARLMRRRRRHHLPSPPPINLDDARRRQAWCSTTTTTNPFTSSFLGYGDPESSAEGEGWSKGS